jgi:hypothetical protein
MVANMEKAHAEMIKDLDLDFMEQEYPNAFARLRKFEEKLEGTSHNAGQDGCKGRGPATADLACA